MMAFSAALGLNHLLEQQGWARERLARHAGSRIELRSPPFPPLGLLVTESGLVAPAEQPGDLKVSINPLALPLLAARSSKTLEYIATEGPQALADTVKALLMELQWDFEEDLSRVIGDVPAHGLAQAGRRIHASQKEALGRLARNFGEYWTEEQPLLARRGDVEEFARRLQELQAGLARAEARLSKKAGPDR